MFARRYTPAVVVSDEPYRLLFARPSEGEEGYGASRVVVDLAVAAKAATLFALHVELTPEWVLPFDTEGCAQRDLSGSLRQGEDYHFRMEISTPHEMASVELTVAIGEGAIDVFLLGWDAV